MGCPVSKRVQTSAELSATPTSQNASDENSNGFLYPSPRRQLAISENKIASHLQNIPGQTNYMKLLPSMQRSRKILNVLAKSRLNHITNSAILKNRSSTRTQSQVEFFAMLDSKIEAGEDLKEEES